MNETILLSLASTLVAVLFGLLVALLAWIGNKLYSKLEELNETMRRIEGDLHERITSIDKRVTKIEVFCQYPEKQGYE